MTDVKEPIILDAEGKVLHDPNPEKVRSENAYRFRTLQWNTTGFFPKILLGGFLGLMLFVGLTVAGIFLGVLLVGFIGRIFLFPRSKLRR